MVQVCNNRSLVTPNSEANPFTHMHKLQSDCTEIQAFKLEVNTFPLPLSQRASCAEYSAYKHPGDKKLSQKYRDTDSLEEVVFVKSCITIITDHA